MSANTVTALAAVAAAIFAGLAWWAALRTYRGSFRPVVRPVSKRHPNDDIAANVLVLKNIGGGPAISVFLVEPKPPPGQRWPPTHPGPIVATADVVEPLGEPLKGGGEESRIGRVVLIIPEARLLRLNATYRLLYQDLTARWHETTFSIESYDEVAPVGHIQRQRMVTRYLGPLKWWQPEYLPKEVREQAQVVQDAE